MFSRLKVVFCWLVIVCIPVDGFVYGVLGDNLFLCDLLVTVRVGCLCNGIMSFIGNLLKSLYAFFFVYIFKFSINI